MSTITVRENLIDKLRQNDMLLVWEDDLDRIADLSIWVFRDCIDEMISCTDQTGDLKCCKTRKKTLEEIKEMLE